MITNIDTLRAFGQNKSISDTSKVSFLGEFILGSITFLMSDRCVTPLRTICSGLRWHDRSDRLQAYDQLAAQITLADRFNWARTFSEKIDFLATPCRVKTDAAGAFIQKEPIDVTRFDPSILHRLNTFYQDQIHWEVVTPWLWTATFVKKPTWILPPIETILGQNLKNFFQKDLSFTKFMTELQMCLAQNPIFESLGVDLLWLWNQSMVRTRDLRMPLFQKVFRTYWPASKQSVKNTPFIYGQTPLHAALESYQQDPFEAIDSYAQHTDLLYDFQEYYAIEFDFNRLKNMLEVALRSKAKQIKLITTTQWAVVRLKRRFFKKTYLRNHY